MIFNRIPDDIDARLARKMKFESKGYYPKETRDRLDELIATLPPIRRGEFQDSTRLARDMDRFRTEFIYYGVIA